MTMASSVDGIPRRAVLRRHPITNPIERLMKNMSITKSEPVLTETIAVRLSEQERHALATIAKRDDRTISYIVRAQLRDFLGHQYWEA
jgi:hypothetical protein